MFQGLLARTTEEGLEELVELILNLGDFCGSRRNLFRARKVTDENKD